MRIRTGPLFAAMALLALSGCGAPFLPSKQGVYSVSPEKVTVEGRSIRATYVRPAGNRHPGLLVVFCTGDGGWFGTSSALFRHLAEEGYTVAGFSAPQILRPLSRSGERASVARAAQGLEEIYAQARSHLGLPESTPILMVGYSRGASMVAFTAVHPELQRNLAGAVAVALVRDADYLQPPEGEHGPGIEVNEAGRLQLHPLLKLLDSVRLAVIQSTNDHYVSAAESRQLLGPDTDRMHLYTVEARNHRFNGGRDKLMHDLDDAMRWVEGGARPAVHPPGTS